ncbi:dipeptidase [Acuticoccus mangrovi]|uniref:Dipeptidase n=1 Tax=Acuticoccus mangrovi TaxID=2796142 RepID=A0A934IRM7_9HYPH|nr:dipeptidase [Acuticoccus mangrovi]MBJ3776992.1 dipeptidase [Acuticoccus mangrovi]
MNAADLHRDAIVIDAACPLPMGDMDYAEWYREGGVTAFAPTVGGWRPTHEAIALIAAWLDRIAMRDDLVHVTTAADIERAKAEGKLGLIFHFQGTDPIGGDLNMVAFFKRLGVGVMQLAYNVRNRIGDGAQEPEDAGLSTFGRAFVARCNAHRVIIDCSHTGRRTGLEAMALSTQPVIFSHANPKAVYPSVRNIDDEQIRAAAATGGVVGAVGFPGFISAAARPTLDAFIDHIDHLVAVAGIDHVSLGLDYYWGQHPVSDDKAALASYERLVVAGAWDRDVYPPPPHYYPEGIETPRTLPALTAGLLRRGYGEADTRKILGLNLLRVYREVWGA